MFFLLPQEPLGKDVLQTLKHSLELFGLEHVSKDLEELGHCPKDE